MPGRPHLTRLPRRPGSTAAWGVVVLAVLAPALAACSGTPEIESYDLSPDEQAACEAFVADLPDVLAEQGRVEVEPDDALGAGYGDPAITVTCGVPVPGGFDQTSRCDEVNGVGWYVPDGSDDDRLDALRCTLNEYREHMHTNEPVHTWP